MPVGMHIQKYIYCYQSYSLNQHFAFNAYLGIKSEVLVKTVWLITVNVLLKVIYILHILRYLRCSRLALHLPWVTVDRIVDVVQSASGLDKLLLSDVRLP
jgi:hypothetical protein